MALTHKTICGVSEHNLNGIDVNFPRETLAAITGLSGSGKSSLAFDTIYAEGQCRYVEYDAAQVRGAVSATSAGIEESVRTNA